MFKFNFDREESESGIQGTGTNTNNLFWKTSEEVIVDEFVSSGKKPSIKVKSDDVVFEVVDVSKLFNEITSGVSRGRFDENFFRTLESSHSDLIASKYEGGFKIWECSHDLIQFLKTNDFDLKDKKVLDLGCGAGLLGIFALQRGATVHFQDYNVEVLRHFTAQNVSLNCENLSTCRFFAGDWQSFSEKYPSLLYDYIFSAETIYNAENHNKLCSVFETKLEENGIGFVAAKAFYFGVGGGTEGFKETVRVRNKLVSSTQWTFKDGLQREILKIERKGAKTEKSP